MERNALADRRNEMIGRTYTVNGERMTASEVWDRYVGGQSPDEFMALGAFERAADAAAAYVASFPVMFDEDAGEDADEIASAIEDYLTGAGAGR